jgi:long-chain fatty acid transport protein
MSKFPIKKAGTLLLSGIASIYLMPAFANNGFYLTGYGAESVMMGGADVAVARDAFATVNNPSGMTQITGQAAEFELAAFTNPVSTHTDSFGNYRKERKRGENGYASAAYARHFENTPFSAGVGGVVQGGLGWQYSGLNTRFGTRDDASSAFAVIRIAPAAAWKVNDQLSLGVALGINYFSGDQELFPNTSVSPAAFPPSGFAGIRFKGASGIGLNSKWGLQYRPVEDVTIGVTYATQTSIPLKKGELRINLSDPGLGGFGVVRYDDAKLTGLRLPEELALGIAFRPTDRLLVSLQDKWYNWSDAIGTLQITATNPRTPGAPPVITIPSAINLVDQHVIEVGFAYDYDKDTMLTFGINHGSRPIPDNSITPIFQLIQARHYMFGAKRELNEGWYVAGNMEWFAFQSVTYDSPLFGPRANSRHLGIVFHGSVGRRW